MIEAFAAKVRNGFASDNAMIEALPAGSKQLRGEMRSWRALPAKVESAFAEENATLESASSKSAERFCIGQYEAGKYFQQMREVLIRGKAQRWTACAAKEQSGSAQETT